MKLNLFFLINKMCCITRYVYRICVEFCDFFFFDLNKKQTIIVLFSMFLKCHEYKLLLDGNLKNISATFVRYPDFLYTTVGSELTSNTQD